MATAAAVAAAAATAVSAGVGAASAAGAFGSGQPGAPKFQQAPRPGYEGASQKYITRVLMGNINNRGPTWNDYLQSGGNATFQLQDTGMRPIEAQKMGFVEKGGAEPAWYTPGQGPLTQQQWEDRMREAGSKTPMGQRYQRIQTLGQRISNLQGKIDAGGLPDARQQRIQDRIDRLTNRKNTLATRGYNPSGAL